MHVFVIPLLKSTAMLPVTVMAVLLACLPGCVANAAEPVAPWERQDAEPAKLPEPALRLRLTDDVIRKAIRETLDDSRENQSAHDIGMLRGNRYELFERRFDDSKVPSCLHADALKLQPAQIGPVGIGGIYALPFLMLAAIRGKCH
jgi:hypothetical protein